jgi:hypothetical protein
MTLPEGLICVPGFLNEAEERDVLAVLAAFELHAYLLHDTPSRRLARSFGPALVTGAYDAGPAAPVTAGLAWLRERCAGLMGREPEELADRLAEKMHRDLPHTGVRRRPIDRDQRQVPQAELAIASLGSHEGPRLVNYVTKAEQHGSRLARSVRHRVPETLRCSRYT